MESLLLYKPHFVIAIITVAFYLIYKEILRPSISMLAAILVFIGSGILEPSDLLRGFSNEAIASIVLLIIITVGLRNNFNIELFLDNLFRGAKTYKGFLFRMMTQVAILSSFVNNTPVVVMMTPYVFSWGKRNNISPSKLLIPLSFATIFGGMITLIGTSTPLVLNGFLIDFKLTTLDIGGLFITGIAVTITGIIFIVFIGHKLLPDRRDIIEKFESNLREYLVETKLVPDSKLIGRSVIAGGLGNFKGMYLVEIIRENKILSPVEPQEIIRANDILIFAGDTENIVEIAKFGLGLELPKQVHSITSEKVEVIEAVISTNSSLIGKRLKNTDFRNRYDAAIVAIHRNGERLSGKIGDTVLRSGDLLLLYAGPEFTKKVDFFRDIYIISNLRELLKPDRRKIVSLAILGLLVIILLAVGYFSLFTSLLIIFSVMTALKMITLQDVKRELDLNLISILVFSLVLGQAIIKTDAGNLVAYLIIGTLEPYGILSILAGLFIVTTLLSSFITNVGAISIAFPVAYSVSQNLQMDGAPFYLVIAYAASAAFLTPISYQTNLIIYGPGGYSFGDFFKVGLPVTVVYLITAFVSIVLIYKDSLL
ncbi:MAG: SLC13 family permease [Bacteroidetes bacterium]|nr:SLC13 family permease [Bacteroidota bacterium]